MDVSPNTRPVDYGAETFDFLLSVFRSETILCNQHHAEPCFALHHASVTISSLFERNRLDHRADVFQNPEGKGVPGIDCRASQ
jgi:hypothetical protein